MGTSETKRIWRARWGNYEEAIQRDSSLRSPMPDWPACTSPRVLWLVCRRLWPSRREGRGADGDQAERPVGRRAQRPCHRIAVLRPECGRERAEHRRAIEIVPANADAHFRYAATWLRSMGRYDQAIDELERAERLAPDLPVIPAGLGLIFTSTHTAPTTRLRHSTRRSRWVQLCRRAPRSRECLSSEKDGRPRHRGKHQDDRREGTERQIIACPELRRGWEKSRGSRAPQGTGGREQAVESRRARCRRGLCGVGPRRTRCSPGWRRPSKSMTRTSCSSRTGPEFEKPPRRRTFQGSRPTRRHSCGEIDLSGPNCPIANAQ